MPDLESLFERRAARGAPVGPDVLYQRALDRLLDGAAPTSPRQPRRTTVAALFALSVVVVLTLAAVLVASGSGGERANPGAGPASRPSVAEDASVTVRVDPAAASAGAAVGVDLETLTRQALDRMAALLEHRHVSVHVSVDPSSKLIIPEWGLGGFGNRTGASIVIDPTRMPRPTLRVWGAAVAHVVYQSVRDRYGPGFGLHLGEAIVSQGLATTFAQQTFGAYLPWADALAQEQQHLFWAAAGRMLDAPLTNETSSEWFLGTGNLPKWAGYTLGVEVVRSYLARHPSEHVADLVKRPASKILDESGYQP